MNIILGNGISAYVIAACLAYKKEDFKIYADITRKCNIPNILYLSCKNYLEAKFYLSIFDITENIDDYIKEIKVGYYYNNCIHENITEEAKLNYLAKQNRANTSSCLSNAANKYLAIDLTKILSKLISKYNISDINDYKLSSKDIIYDTININNLILGKESKEYLVKNDIFNIQKYDYVYDCSDSDIKRYTKEFIEYIKKPNVECITINNYYDSPKIYKYKNIILLGRYSTKTQMKQKDIIDYIILKKGNVIYV